MWSSRECFGGRIRLETVTGPEFVRAGTRVVPVARLLRVSFGGDGDEVAAGLGGLSYSRQWPSAVIVSAGGTVSRLPVIDVTRWAQVAIVLGALTCTVEMWRRATTRKERS